MNLLFKKGSKSIVLRQRLYPYLIHPPKHVLVCVYLHQACSIKPNRKKYKHMNTKHNAYLCLHKYTHKIDMKPLKYDLKKKITKNGNRNNKHNNNIH